MKVVTRPMFLPFFSAALGVLAVRLSYLFGFIFLVPLIWFFLRRRSFPGFFAGVFAFFFLLALGVVYFVFEPLIFFLLVLIFSGAATILFFIRKIFGEKLFLVLFPFLWTFVIHLSVYLGGIKLYPASILTPANILGSSPFLGLAVLGGFWPLTFFVSLTNVLVVGIIYFLNDRKKVRLMTVVLIIIIFVGWAVSFYLLRSNGNAYRSVESRLKVALVSVNGADFDDEVRNFPARNFFAPREEQEKRFRELLAKKLEPLKKKLFGQNPDLVILPEGMFDVAGAEDILLSVYGQLARDLGAGLVVGLYSEQGGKVYNTTFLLDQSGGIEDFYNKHVLMIIGEHWPFGDWRPFYYEWLRGRYLSESYAVYNPDGRLAVGDKKNLNFKDVNFALAVCGEIHYPGEVKESKKLGARFISNNSGNRWVIGLKDYLHLTNNLRRIEAVWLGVPVLVNGRYDFAGVVTPDGQVDLIYQNDPENDFQVFVGEIRI